MIRATLTQYVTANSNSYGSEVTLGTSGQKLILDGGMRGFWRRKWLIESQEISAIPVWGNFSFASGVLNVAYEQHFDLSPAPAPTTYTLVSGALPTGLSLADVSGDEGKISGIPTAVGSFSFTLRATNAYGTADKAFSITINGGGGGSYTFAA